jgi:trehalose/maltose hydrolase-like predicted phosphorylase
MPNWLCLNFRIEDDEWFDLNGVEILNYSQRLNLREGILYRDVVFRDNAGRETKLSERRFVHMHYSHVAGIEIVLSAINWAGKLTIRTALDGRVVNGGDQIDPRVRAKKHLHTIDRCAQGDGLLLKVSTTETGLVVAEAAKTVVLIDGSPVDAQRTDILEQEYVAQDIRVSIAQSQSVSVRKTVVLYTSRDKGIYEPGITALEALANVSDFEVLICHQVQAWRSLWSRFDLFVETTEEYSKLVPSLLLHLNSFHVLQTASPHTVDLDTSVPARGWTGEGYQGHVFWDDLFVFPFINMRMPNISAALLKYRFRRLPEARKIARSHGAGGACFPWQSASDGCERTPSYWWMPAKQKWIRDYTHLEIHVNGAIAWNVWQYFQVTMDEDFMYSYGCEILLEIARFFATRAKYVEERGRYEIHGVIGPDEFHNGYPNFVKPGVNNNAYTNLMAVWTLCRALELLERLPADHREHMRMRLDITDDELALWDAVSRKMFVPMMNDGVIAQFEGYEDLEEFPGRSNGIIDHDALQRALSENDGYLNQYKISKQADVLMLSYVFSPAELQELIERLGYPHQAASIAKNSEYYIARTANESTLSRVAHAWTLSRVDRIHAAELIPFCRVTGGDTGQEASDQVFFDALGSDYFDVAARGTTKTGIHMGAMAGTVDIVQRCYKGIVTRGDVLWIDPVLPRPLLRLSFTLRYRRQSLSFDIDHENVKVSAWHSTAKPVKIGFGKQVYVLNAGDTKIFRLADPDKGVASAAMDRTDLAVKPVRDYRCA